MYIVEHRKPQVLPLDVSITTVGMEFTSGSETNVEIGNLLGVKGAVPDYCRDDVESLSALEECGVVAFIFQTTQTSKRQKFVPEFVAAFEMNETMYATFPQETEALAAACALWFVAGHKSPMT